MQLLLAIDENGYSRYAVDEAARLAANTWPDVVMLTTGKTPGSFAGHDSGSEPAPPGVRLLNRSRADFLSALGLEEDLYGAGEGTPFALRNGAVLEKDVPGRKNFSLRLRDGDPAKAIVAEARAAGSDLIIIGSGHHEGGWGNAENVAGRVAEAVDCSVYIVRENRAPTRVVCCLDHANVSQESLELINQWVTLYGAELEVAGVLRHGDLKEEVESKMAEVLDYYLSRDIPARVRVVDEESLESFLESGGEGDLMALWLPHQAAFKRFFKKSRVASLVNHASSSILILR